MKKDIFVVDDSADNRLILRAYLLKQGYNVITAKDGTEALSLLTTCKPSLIISDIMMPHMGGFEFLETLKKMIRFDDIPVVLMSCKDEDLVNPIAKDLQAYSFLEKPVDLVKLKIILETALSKDSILIET